MNRSKIAPSPHPDVHHHRPRRIIVFAALLTVALPVGLVGCGGASPSAGAPSPSHPASAATSNAPSPTPTLPTSAQLKAALLTAADLGPSFASSTSTDTSGTTVSGCPALAALINGSTSAGQTVQAADYSAGDTGPYVGESLMTEPSAALDADYAQTKAALTSCTALSITSSGVALDFTLTPIHFGDPGSASVRMDATVQGIQVNGYIAIQRLGTVALTFYYFQLASGSSQTASQYYTQAVTKAQSVLANAAM